MITPPNTPPNTPPSTPPTAPAATRHVLVVGIDGVRLDLLAQLHTPHLDRVAEQGFLAPVRIDDPTPTMSGPCWATILTGVDVTKHAVWGNDLSGNRLRVFPDFTTRLAAERGRRTAAVGGWAPLFLAQDGGPLFLAPSRLCYIAPQADTPEAWEECDESVATEAARLLIGEAGLDACFVYLGSPDETAHFRGCGADYREAVEAADRRLGRLLSALDGRPGRADEQWTVIVVTDHGHREAGGHGGRSTAERTAWIAACGPDIPADAAPGALRHADVAAHAYRALDIPLDHHWTLDGRPFAVREPSLA
ncbi:alkaline phosphatase family protein [Kitasatospora sp. NPDC085464]|uniref:alkaline phosphatase family protein n=1 Tax=Kitasatospora sp. NPDC085464 TaxID=3364063 RepID=UPI0037CBFBF7